MYHIFCLVLMLCIVPCHVYNKPPHITVVVIVDQLSEHIVHHHRQFLTGGLKTLLEDGAYFSHAYYPHGQPETATGHAMISTGAYASQHGLVANEWIGPDGKRTNACDDRCPNTKNTVFSQTDKTGKSAQGMRAQTLATCCVKHAPCYKVISLALKSRAAIPLAGPDGLAIWFDTKAGYFTSSTAFCPQLPPFVSAFNTHLSSTLHTQKTTQWKPCFSPQAEQYQWVDPLAYTYAGNAFSLIETPQPFTKKDGSPYYHVFEQSPESSAALLRLGRLAISMHTKYKPKQPLLLFVSLSNFDYAGHYYGPYSKEVIDILYHIDKQLDWFIQNIQDEYGKDNCLFALTADHGVLPIPEILKKRGNYKAQRLDATAIVKELNRIIYNTFDVKNLIKTTLPPHFYVDNDKWLPLDEETQHKIIPAVKSYFESIPGILHAWHKSDLENPEFKTWYSANDRANWFALQYMKDRSGDFIVQVAPFAQLSLYPKGTSHDSPYDYDVRVPVAFYGPNITPGVHDQPASMRHFASTLAHLLGVKKPANAPRAHWGPLLKKNI